MHYTLLSMRSWFFNCHLILLEPLLDYMYVCLTPNTAWCSASWLRPRTAGVPALVKAVLSVLHLVLHKTMVLHCHLVLLVLELCWVGNKDWRAFLLEIHHDIVLLDLDLTLGRVPAVTGRIHYNLFSMRSWFFNCHLILLEPLLDYMYVCLTPNPAWHSASWLGSRTAGIPALMKAVLSALHLVLHETMVLHCQLILLVLELC
jgi:hypothetical protein